MTRSGLISPSVFFFIKVEHFTPSYQIHVIIAKEANEDEMATGDNVTASTSAAGGRFYPYQKNRPSIKVSRRAHEFS